METERRFIKAREGKRWGRKKEGEEWEKGRKRNRALLEVDGGNGQREGRESSKGRKRMEYDEREKSKGYKKERQV